MKMKSALLTAAMMLAVTGSAFAAETPNFDVVVLPDNMPVQPVVRAMMEAGNSKAERSDKDAFDVQRKHERLYFKDKMHVAYYDEWVNLETKADEKAFLDRDIVKFGIPENVRLWTDTGADSDDE